MDETADECQQLAGLLTVFETALDAGNEATIQKFLEDDPRPFRHLTIDGTIADRFCLADAYIPDFVAIGREQHRQRIEPVVTFIEIERADEPLFTRSGDPTSFLTHALRQVQDWKKWVTDNRMYLQPRLQKVLIDGAPKEEPADEDHSWRFQRRQRLQEGILHGFKDRYLVVAGRRKSMKISDRLRLTQMTDDLHEIDIITYDALLEEIFRELIWRRREGQDYYG